LGANRRRRRRRRLWRRKRAGIGWFYRSRQRGEVEVGGFSSTESESVPVPLPCRRRIASTRVWWEKEEGSTHACRGLVVVLVGTFSSLSYPSPKQNDSQVWLFRIQVSLMNDLSKGGLEKGEMWAAITHPCHTKRDIQNQLIKHCELASTQKHNTFRKEYVCPQTTQPTYRSLIWLLTCITYCTWEDTDEPMST
jgi:hypothetical protein